MSILAIVTFTGLAVALLTACMVYLVLNRRTIVQQRLEELIPKEQEKPSFKPGKSPWKDLLSGIGEKLKIRKKEHSNYAKMLAAAGFTRGSVSLFLGIKIFFGVLLPLIFLLFYAFPRGVILRFDSLLYCVALAICGFLLPSLWLYRRVEYRKTEIFHTLPDVLDLLTICVEAGLGMDAALIRASENPIFKGNPLAEELKIASRETRAGKPRSDALHDLAERTMVDDVKSFVTMLIQTERFGTSLSLALRVYSDSLRTKRSQIAQEAAAKTTIKILFPLAFFIFPALMLVIVGPAFYKILQTFK
jgi:tight adherence protein C